MRLRNVKDAPIKIEKSSFVVHHPEQYKGRYASLFGNNHPIHLEIGMGKGQFLLKMAMLHPEINFIGVEKYDSILVRAVEKIEESNLSNIKVMKMDAQFLQEVFDHEIDIIYLNFSDPWPKTRHAKRRLTSSVFLPIYDSLFRKEPTIIQKTDNIGLFASSIVSLSSYGYTITECSLDLANADMPNCTTEYEEKFMAKEEKINYLKAVKK